MAIDDLTARAPGVITESPRRGLREIVLAHQRGDRDAFAELVRVTFPSLSGHALRKLRDPRAAEDAVQDTYLRAYRALPSLGGEYEVSAWLHRILANVCVDEGNRRRREADVNARWSAQPVVTQGADEASVQLDAVRAVAAAIATLPPNYREALVLRDVMELDYADVASRAGITEDNARARVHRARLALRRLVDASLVLGGLVGARVRRVVRFSSQSVQHVSQTASSAAMLQPDVVSSIPARVSVAAASVTAAAIVAVSAVPAITGGSANNPTAPRGGSSVQVASAPEPPTTVQAVTVVAAGETPTSLENPVVVLGSTVTPSVTPGASVTTTSVRPRLHPAVQPAPAPAAAGAPNTDGPTQPRAFPGGWLNLWIGGGTTSGSRDGDGRLTIGDDATPVPGHYSGTVQFPTGTDCAGHFDVSFLWEGSDGSTYLIDVQGTITTAGTSARDQRRAYSIAGTAQVQGDPASGFVGSAVVSGTLSVGSSAYQRSAAQLDIASGSADSAPAPACQAAAVAPGTR